MEIRRSRPDDATEIAEMEKVIFGDPFFTISVFYLIFAFKFYGISQGITYGTTDQTTAIFIYQSFIG